MKFVAKIKKPAPTYRSKRKYADCSHYLLPNKHSFGSSVCRVVVREVRSATIKLGNTISKFEFSLGGSTIRLQGRNICWNKQNTFSLLHKYCDIIFFLNKIIPFYKWLIINHLQNKKLWNDCMKKNKKII